MFTSAYFLGTFLATNQTVDILSPYLITLK